MIFSEFDPDSGGGLHGRERRDGVGEDRLAALPWQGNNLFHILQQFPIMFSIVSFAVTLFNPQAY